MSVVPDIVRNVATRFPTREGVIDDRRRLRFAEVDDRADRLARLFAERGLHRADRVALLAANDAEYLEIQVGAQRAGVTLVPLNYRLAVPELAWIVQDCEPALGIVGTGYGEVGAALPFPDVLHYGSDGPGDD